jgi:hypothetical protein
MFVFMKPESVKKGDTLCCRTAKVFLRKEHAMIGELDPIEGSWYHHLDKDLDFMVVDVNEKEGTIDIQYFDGDIEELEMEEWEEMDLEEIEPPEDWTGPLDDLESDDRDYD